MNKYKKIALQLGIVIPSCLLSIGDAQAADIRLDMVESKQENEVINMLISTNSSETVSSSTLLDHTNSHTDLGGDHTDDHTDRDHTDFHSNRNAVMKGNMCQEHADSHSDYGQDINEHTNSGNRYHTNYHTDRQDAIRNC
ncbi:MAG: hypothetical protein E7131_05030 [Rikenellaceae bacterium]|nr:hypothetical protein [Rikenellaceae bacterium]